MKAFLSNAGVESAAGRDVIEVKLSVARVIRIKRETEQPLFLSTGRQQLANVEERHLVIGAGAEMINADNAEPIDNEHSIGITRRRGHEKRLGQP
jgi:hypothetical protein